MERKSQNWLRFFGWFRKILFTWIRTTVIPADPTNELQLNSSHPVCYVLRARSITDLMVLSEICKRRGLPIPERNQFSVLQEGGATFVTLRKVGLIAAKRFDSESSAPLEHYLKELRQNQSKEVQIVPVSIFWGRNPGRDERSILKLLFFDDEHAGVIQKFFIALAQGRSTFVQFGRPISLREFVNGHLTNEGADIAGTLKKLVRVLKIHFRRQRNVALGPSLPNRDVVIANIIRAKPVKEAILEESRKKKISEERAESLARKYAKEIASNQKYSFIRVADILMTWLWTRLFNGVTIKNSHRLRDIDSQYEIVYLPSHRSHMDYLLLAYTLYYEGQPTPHTAAGVNLNFWPAGPLLRMGGAFYLRRTFSGNRLYATVFNEYVHYLATKGHPIKFYLEGGRSRTGKLLSGKTGLLAMIVQSYLRNSDKPIVFMPIYTGYDKVMEIRTYQTELRGVKKTQESLMQLFKAGKALKSNFGKAYIGFGEPIYLGDFLDKHASGWRDELVATDPKPKWMGPVVADLAERVLTRVNETAVVSPIGLFALVMLSIPARALPEDDLLYFLDKITSFMKKHPYSPSISLPSGQANDFLQNVLKIAPIKRFQHPGGDVIHLDDWESGSLAYYRNNILHLNALPALIAAFFTYNTTQKVDELMQGVSLLYPFLKNELFLRWEYSEKGEAADSIHQGVILTTIEGMITEGLLFRDDGDTSVLMRPAVTERDLATLRILAWSIGPILERYAVSTAILAGQSSSEKIIKTEKFEQQCQLMARRIAILGGNSEPELYEKSLFVTFFTTLKELGYITVSDENEYRSGLSLNELSTSALSLLSPDIRQSIMRSAADS